MDARTRSTLGYIGVAIAAALITGAAVWAIAQNSVTEAEDRASGLEEDVAQLESQIESLTVRLDAAYSADDAGDEVDSATDDDSTDTSSDGAATTTSSEDGRHFCYVREVENESGTTYVTVDYAEMLTGAEAAAAASAAGAESPPPNDYWISNVNPRLRTFPVRPGIDVELTSTSDGTNPDGYSVNLGQWQDFFVGMSPGMEVVQDVPYWIEIEGGVVTEIEEQYLP